MITIAAAYANLLAEGLKQLRMLEAAEVPLTRLRNFETSVSYNIRWYSIEPGMRYDASEAAIAKFPSVDLHRLAYKDQLKAERTVDQSIRKRSLLKLEHKTCVADIWGKIKSSDGTPAAIEKILLEMQIVWVLVEEDKRLQVSKRGDDHDAAYEAAGIKVIRKTKGP